MEKAQRTFLLHDLLHQDPAQWTEASGEGSVVFMIQQSLVRTLVRTNVGCHDLEVIGLNPGLVELLVHIQYWLTGQ